MGDKTAYNDRNIAFLMDGESVSVGNIVYECFHRSIPMHSHSDNSYEIHYISSGHGMVTISGEEYDTLPGTLYITGPHVKHSMVPDDKDPLSEFCIYLKLSPDGKTGRSGLSPLKLFREMSIWYGKDGYGIHALMRSLFAELGEESIGYRTVVESLIRQIIIACVRNYSVNEESSDLRGTEHSDNQYLIIEEAFLYEYATLTLPILAGRLNLSTRQTQRLLIEHYGMTFQSKKTEAKMSAAALMLGLPDKTVTEIADELGYSSVEHFSSAFKKFYGMSASKYRKKVIK
ncbi:AraC-like ligand binding domain-containing protein [Lachnospiraceae bacterium XBB2008]|nr:AraC-like ligand binding domain-containing protein [Lachnospiraceae bacterium XBB2008]